MLPEEIARKKIDKQLIGAGWDVVSRDEYVPRSTSAVKEALMQGNKEVEYRGGGKGVIKAVQLGENLTLPPDYFQLIIVYKHEIIGLNLKSQLNHGFCGLVLILLTLKIADTACQMSYCVPRRSLLRISRNLAFKPQNSYRLY